MNPGRGALADLGRSILARVEAKNTRGLPAALAAFVDGLAALDGRVSPGWSPPKLSPSELALVSKLVAIEIRNTLEGDDPRLVPELPPTSTPLEALEARLVIVARSSFDVFVEMVATATDKRRQVVPVVQARIHRAWTKICDAPENERVIIISHNEAGKSQQLAILRPLYDLGRDPTLKSVILTNVAAGAVSRIRAIADFIMTNTMVQKIFPDLKPHPDGPWNTTQLRVVRPGIEKEPSIEAFGLKGAILGSRVDRIYADDLLDSENTATLAGINDLNAWWMANIETRLTSGCRVIIVGTPWRPRDLLHTLEALTEDYRTFRFPIIDAEGNCTWPEVWTEKRIAQRRRVLSALEFARSMMCVARSSETSAFSEADIKAAIERGDGHPHIHSLQNFPGGKAPEGARIYVGVDLAASQKKNADDSAIYTLMVEKSGRHTTLSIEAGKWTPSELQTRIIDHNGRYRPRAIAVESNGAQVFFVSTLQGLGLPVRAFTTGANKHDQGLGVEAQSTVFKNGLWLIPSRGGQTSAEVKRWVHELTFYDRNSHAGDVLMAGWIAFATAKADAVVTHLPTVGVTFIGASPDAPANDTRGFVDRLFDQPIEIKAPPSGEDPDIALLDSPDQDIRTGARARINIARVQRQNRAAGRPENEGIHESGFRAAARTPAVIQAEADARERERNERHSRGDSLDDDDPWVYRDRGPKFGGGNGPLGGLGF